MPKILHILERLSGGGTARAMLSLVKYQNRLNLPYQHDVVTLEKGHYPFTHIQAKKLGMNHADSPDVQTLTRLISQADIVHLHFYNSPAQYQFLRTAWPAHRRIIWYAVSGEYAPQCLAPQLVQSADKFVSMSPLALELPQVQGVKNQIEYIPLAVDFERLGSVNRRSQDQFTIGYIGTVNFGKLHPDFAQMCADVDIPNSRFVVCGGDNMVLKDQLRASGILNRFSFKGFVENVGQELATFDVFGYPLTLQTFAAGETSLQEAMAAAVPPVVFPYGGIRFIVENGRTGIVVQTPQEYSEAITGLYHQPKERLRLGQNAQAHIQANFNPLETAKAFDRQYQQLMEQPQRLHDWPGVSENEDPSAYFAEVVYPCAPCFAQSLEGPNQTAEQQIIHSYFLLSSGEGGLFQYRNFYPDAPLLRFWCGLALLGLNKADLARKEFQAALTLGINPAYCAPYHQS